MGGTSKAVLRTEEGALGYFDRLTEPAHGEMDQAAVALLLRVEEVHQECCSWVAPTMGASRKDIGQARTKEIRQ